jgi:hypothetical protein
MQQRGILYQASCLKRMEMGWIPDADSKFHQVKHYRATWRMVGFATSRHRTSLCVGLLMSGIDLPLQKLHCPR